MFKKKTVRIEFYDVESGQTIGYDEKRPKRIPENFDAETFVEISGQRYEVVRAEPSERKLLKKADVLVIHIKRIQENAPGESAGQEENPHAQVFSEKNAVHPSQVISEKSIQAKRTYFQPSRADEFPAFTGQKDDLHLLEMGAWEYRQAEFAHQVFAEAIRSEFFQIERSRERYAQDDGERTLYTQQHRRKYAAKPLGQLELDPEALHADHFPQASPFDGLTFMKSDGYADGGFAFRLPSGLPMYGSAANERIRHLALLPNGPRHAHLLGQDIDQLREFMAAHSLILIDWNHLQILEATREDLAAWLDWDGPEEAEESEEESIPRESPETDTLVASTEAPAEQAEQEDLSAANEAEVAHVETSEASEDVSLTVVELDDLVEATDPAEPSATGEAPEEPPGPDSGQGEAPVKPD